MRGQVPGLRGGPRTKSAINTTQASGYVRAWGAQSQHFLRLNSTAPIPAPIPTSFS